MRPTLNPDSNLLKRDWVWAVRWGLWDWQGQSKLKRGDIVIFTSPTHPTLTVVKRIVALEGDVVSTRAPYPLKQQEIPAGHAWVEGDERFHSRDSNEYGPVILRIVLCVDSIGVGRRKDWWYSLSTESLWQDTREYL